MFQPPKLGHSNQAQVHAAEHFSATIPFMEVSKFISHFLKECHNQSMPWEHGNQTPPEKYTGDNKLNACS